MQLLPRMSSDEIKTRSARLRDLTVVWELVSVEPNESRMDHPQRVRRVLVPMYVRAIATLNRRLLPPAFITRQEADIGFELV